MNTMQLIKLNELYNKYKSFIKKYVWVEGYYKDGFLYEARDNRNQRIICPKEDYLSIDYYLKRMQKFGYEGKMRVVGIPGRSLTVYKNISHIVKIELLDDQGTVIESYINKKITLPKELRGKI